MNKAVKQRYHVTRERLDMVYDNFVGALIEVQARSRLICPEASRAVAALVASIESSMDDGMKAIDKLVAEGAE